MNMVHFNHILKPKEQKMSAKSTKRSGVSLRGFSRGLVAEKIVGATDQLGESTFSSRLVILSTSLSLFSILNLSDPSGRDVTRLI